MSDKPFLETLSNKNKEDERKKKKKKLKTIKSTKESPWRGKMGSYLERKGDKKRRLDEALEY